MSDLAPEIRDSLAAAMQLMADAAKRIEEAMKKLLGDEAAEGTKGPCVSCSKKSECKEQQPCAELEKLLPGVEAGRGRNEVRTGVDADQEERWTKGRHLDVVRDLNADRFLGLFARFETSKEIFTEKQWAAIMLRFRDGKTHLEIARLLGIKSNSVSDLLSRAEQKLQRHWDKLREERRNHDSSSD